MKLFRIAGFLFVFSVLFTSFAFADVAGMGYIIGGAVLVCAIAIAIVIIAITLLVKAIQRKRNK